MNNNKKTLFLSTSDVAEIFGIPVKTILKMAKAKKIE